MKRYPEQHRQAVIQKLLESPLSMRQFALLEGISISTLFSWKIKYLPNYQSESVLPDKNNSPSESGSSELKFAIVLETASFSAAQLSEYCRSKGLYPEQVNEWKAACLSANQTQAQTNKQQALERKADLKRIKELEKELQRKDAALAETAALLVLRKKLNAYWGEDGGN